jgi:hypothetical protein
VTGCGWATTGAAAGADGAGNATAGSSTADVVGTSAVTSADSSTTGVCTETSTPAGDVGVPPRETPTPIEIPSAAAGRANTPTETAVVTSARTKILVPTPPRRSSADPHAA